MATVASVLGADLLQWFSTSSAYSGGVWTKDAASHASSVDFSQGNSNCQPTATTTTGGYNGLAFAASPASSEDALTGGGVGGLPGAYGAGDYIFGMVCNLTQISPGSNQQVFRQNNDGRLYVDGDGSGKIAFDNTNISDASILGSWKSIIIIGNSTNTRCWVDGALQTATAAGSVFGGPTWSPGGAYSSFEFGCHNAGTGFESGQFLGSIASPFWGWKSSAFSSGTIDAVAAALAEYLTTPGFSSVTSGPDVTIRAARIFDRETGRG